MSEAVERRLLELLDHPTESPYGNPIPGLEELGDLAAATFRDGVVPLDTVAGSSGDRRVRIARISEEMQKDGTLMAALRRVGALPGQEVAVRRSATGVLIGSGGELAEIGADLAEHVFVEAR